MSRMNNHEAEALRDELHEKNKRIAELLSENIDLKFQLMSVNKISGKLSDNLTALEKQNDKLQRALNQAHDVMSGLINKMMIQTIAQKTHGERNQQLREWSRRLLQILDNISSGNNTDGIPF